jgi:hypothetical protein
MSDTEYNLDEHQQRHAKLNKPDIQKKLLCISSHMRYLEVAN